MTSRLLWEVITFQAPSPYGDIYPIGTLSLEGRGQG